MIAAIVLAMILAKPDPWCDSVAQLTQATIAARESGISEAEASAAARAMPDPQAQQAALAVIWYVYNGNDDGRIPPARLVAMVRRACLAPPNALTLTAGATP